MVRDLIKEMDTTRLAYMINHEIRKYRTHVYSRVKENMCDNEFLYDYFNDQYLNKVIIIKDISSALSAYKVEQEIKNGKLFILIYDESLSNYGQKYLEKLRGLIPCCGSSFIEICKYNN